MQRRCRQAEGRRYDFARDISGLLTPGSLPPDREGVYLRDLEAIRSVSTPTHGIRLVGRRAVGGYEILAALGKGGRW